MQEIDSKYIYFVGVSLVPSMNAWMCDVQIYRQNKTGKEDSRTATQSDILLFIRYRVTMTEKSEENFQFAEEIGLDVKAVACDRTKNNKVAVRKFVNGIYDRRRADGSIHCIFLLYDYPHILESFISKFKQASGYKEL